MAPGDYEQRLAAFHAALRAAPSPGLGDTAVLGLGAVPWLGGARGYEDWYLVDGFPALGALNEAAVARPAARAARRRRGVGGAPAWRASWATWRASRCRRVPAGRRGSPSRRGCPTARRTRELAGALAGTGAAGWQRQMTLGPATEYCVLAAAPSPLPWPAVHAWPVRPVVPPAGG